VEGFAGTQRAALALWLVREREIEREPALPAERPRAKALQEAAAG